MFDNIMQTMEREVVRDTKFHIDNLKLSKYRAIGHHISSLLVATVAFVLILYSVVTFDLTEDRVDSPAFAFILLAAIIILIHSRNKSKPKYIDRFLHIFIRLRLFWEKHWYADYLAGYFWMSLTGYIFIFLFLLGMLIHGGGEWIDKESISNTEFASTIDILLTMATGLLAAEIALFSLMMQQVLGKYSGVVAQTVVGHRAIKVLFLYPLSGLIVLMVIFYYGCPESIQDYVLPLIGLMLFLGLIISVFLSKSGLHESSAIKYVGVANSRRIKRSMPPPIDNSSRSARYIWRPLNYLGLDYRNVDRYQLMNAPKSGSGIAIESLGAMLGVANKAIVEGQDDVFVASLASIETIMKGYAERRALYFGSEDQVFTYLNYQLAALIESASKAPNQYLISNLAATVGSISKLTYCIGKFPESADDQERPAYIKNNFTTSLWMGLLFQIFQHTHELTRSTAAHESIIQMSELAIISINNKDSDAITLSYLPTIEKVHDLCMLRLTDPYHQNLAGMCYRKLVESLMYIAYFRDKLAGIHEDPFEATLELLSKLSKQYLAVLHIGSMNLDDPINALLSKTDQERYCLQEIFFVTLNRKLSDRRDYAVAKSDIRTLIECITDLGTFAVSQEIYNAGHYLEAFFEISYLVIRGLPASFVEYDNIENEKNASYRLPNDPIDTQRDLTLLIFENFRKLYVGFYKSTRVMLDWQQSALSVMGIGIMRYISSGEDYLKDQIVETARMLYALVAEDYASGTRPHHDSEKYLQLLGAWLSHFEIDDNLAGEIANLIAANQRSRGLFSGSSGGQFGPYDYPTISFNDFFLYPLRNISDPPIMSEATRKEFIEWGERLICQDALIPFYSQIQTIHAGDAG